ncbi:MAG: murein biosynthesis integral membrane protein MurJ [bacterium]|nr:murein biosynthesis integral membrane protein MurJ [bacterium]
MRTNGQSITAVAALIAALSFASRLLGLVRDRVLAGTFGAGEVLDAYYAAFRIPDVVFNLLGLAALSAAFLPIFMRLRQRDRTDAHRFASRVFSNAALLLIVLAAIGALAAGPLFAAIAPGFTAAQLALTASFGRVLFIATILLGLSSVVGGVLQAEERFLAFAAAPLLYNIGIIAGVLLLVPVLGPIGIAWGVVAGAGGHLVLQGIAARRTGLRLRWSPSWRNEHVRAMVRQLLPRIAALGAQQVQLLVIAGIASTLAAGSLAVFTLAVNIAMVPVALFGYSFAIAAFPRFSGAVAAGDLAQFRDHFSQTFRQIALLAFPAIVALLALKAQIVRVILGTGAFGWADTVRTLETLEAFGFGLFFLMIVPLCTRAFYAWEDTRTPFVVSIIADGIGIVAAWFLGRAMGPRGLAFGFAIAAGVQSSLLLLALRRRAGALDESRINGALLKFGIAAIAMGVVIQLVKPGIASLLGTETFVGIALQGALAGGLGFGAYLGVGVLLRSSEITALAKALHTRVLRAARLPTGGADEARG